MLVPLEIAAFTSTLQSTFHLSCVCVSQLASGNLEPLSTNLLCLHLDQSGLGNTGVFLGDFNHFFAWSPEKGLLTNWIANFATEKCNLANSDITALATEKLHMSVSILIKFCIKDSRKYSFQLISSFGKISIYCLVPSSYHFSIFYGFSLLKKVFCWLWITHSLCVLLLSFLQIYFFFFSN